MSELWQNILDAKRKAEAKYPIESHQSSWEERDMHIFASMVKAAMGQSDNQDDLKQPDYHKDFDPNPSATREPKQVESLTAPAVTVEPTQPKLKG